MRIKFVSSGFVTEYVEILSPKELPVCCVMLEYVRGLSWETVSESRGTGGRLRGVMGISQEAVSESRGTTDGLHGGIDESLEAVSET